ncbi:MAG: hypothetical protein Q9205_004558, partial [Flavoplaca limonia]
MKPLASLAVFSALLVNSSVVALPQTQPTRQYVVNCTNERAITDVSCWNTLKVADYLASWTRTTPNCTGTTPNGVGCCISDEPWSTCFIRLGTALERRDFTTAKILRDFNVDSQEIPNADTLRSVLPIPLVLGLSIANLTSTDPEAAEAAATWSSALEAAPAVRQALFSDAIENSQQLTVMAPPLNSVSVLLANVLRLVMSNMTTFINFTSEGRFTPYPSIPSTRFNPAAGLQTFLLSKLMQTDTYYAIPMEVVDRTTYESTSAADTRNYYYWSPSTHRMYELRNKGRVHIDKFALADHILNDGWGDAQWLFDGSYNCTAAGNAGAAIVNEKPDGGIDFSCVSQLPM